PCLGPILGYIECRQRALLLDPLQIPAARSRSMSAGSSTLSNHHQRVRPPPHVGLERRYQPGLPLPLRPLPRREPQLLSRKPGDRRPPVIAAGLDPDHAARVARLVPEHILDRELRLSNATHAREHRWPHPDGPPLL